MGRERTCTRLDKVFNTGELTNGRTSKLQQIKFDKMFLNRIGEECFGLWQKEKDAENLSR